MTASRILRDAASTATNGSQMIDLLLTALEMMADCLPPGDATPFEHVADVAAEFRDRQMKIAGPCLEAARALEQTGDITPVARTMIDPLQQSAMADLMADFIRDMRTLLDDIDAAVVGEQLHASCMRLRDQSDSLVEICRTQARAWLAESLKD